jgi:signal transduction histidine kinase
MTPESKQAEIKEPDQIREEIEETREELGDTVAALAGKSDVRAQARKKLEEASETAERKLAEVRETIQRNPGPAAAAGGAVALVMLVRRVRRRRSG